MEQIGKDKTSFQVFFQKIIGSEAASDIVEFLNDMCMFFTIPSDLLADHAKMKMVHFVLIYLCNFHVLRDLLLIYICNLHWNRTRWS